MTTSRRHEKNAWRTAAEDVLCRSSNFRFNAYRKTMPDFTCDPGLRLK